MALKYHREKLTLMAYNVIFFYFLNKYNKTNMIQQHLFSCFILENSGMTVGNIDNTTAKKHNWYLCFDTAGNEHQWHRNFSEKYPPLIDASMRMKHKSKLFLKSVDEPKIM